jgi:hypothetical protein
MLASPSYSFRVPGVNRKFHVLTGTLSHYSAMYLAVIGVLQQYVIVQTRGNDCDRTASKWQAHRSLAVQRLLS